MRKRFKNRKGFTLFELVIIATIIIILTSIAIYNYINLTRRAKLARTYEEFSYIAYYLELYKIDWGGYPVIPAGEPFGKNTDGATLTSTLAIELTGSGISSPYINITSNKTLTGEAGGIPYAPLGVIISLYNSFIPSQDYFYKSDSTGSNWALYLNLSNGKVLYRTVTQINIIEADSPPEP